MSFSTLGKHVVVDAWGVTYKLLNDEQLLKKYMAEVAETCGLTVLSMQDYKFEPQGVTIIMLIAESHFSIHTYPEKEFAAIDCYTCGEAVNALDVVTKLLAMLRPDNFFTKELVRGLGPIKILEN